MSISIEHLQGALPAGFRLEQSGNTVRMVIADHPAGRVELTQDHVDFFLDDENATKGVREQLVAAGFAVAGVLSTGCIRIGMVDGTLGGTYNLPPSARQHTAALPSAHDAPASALLGPMAVPQRAMFEAGGLVNSGQLDPIRATIEKGWGPASFKGRYRYVPFPAAAFGAEPWAGAARQVSEHGTFTRYPGKTLMNAPQFRFLLGVEKYAKALLLLDEAARAAATDEAVAEWTRVQEDAGSKSALSMAALVASDIATLDRDPDPANALKGLYARLASARDAGGITNDDTLILQALSSLWLHEPSPDLPSKTDSPNTLQVVAAAGILNLPAATNPPEDYVQRLLEALSRRP
ncbi:MAG: hypothetical protein IPK82_29370 [Polyangiaceae bacterium]|nr:hypothetical protein [Polyangiaceae bacterium]